MGHGFAGAFVNTIHNYTYTSNMIYYYDIQYFMMICIQCEKTRKIYVVIGWWFFAFPVDKLKVELAIYIYRIGYSLLIIIWNSDNLYTDYTDCIHSNVRWDVL